ncbi:DUF6286 domain-containing protein [Streptomyces indicus]|uniref:DUF6286 domain-containing protein n=1 Tax=Streptomyces indicus TaxID=417292 RepID=A0A1G9FBW6_9ACTN|nr:DUF6286 domain-containing protein [Streptomyces indicus]SDK85871.1 hypothetical protein SAMN05421806_11331 [Streptomyces indicus]
MSEGPDGRAQPPGPDGEATTRSLPVLEKAEGGPPVPATAGAAAGELDQASSAARYAPVVTPEEDGDGGRLWSVRRIWAGALALLLAVGAALLIYDLAAVRAEQSAMAWRKELARQLAGRTLDDRWVLAGAALAALTGIGLLVLAATPGHRSALPLRSGSPEVRAWLDSAAAALVLRDRAMEVAGVQSVRVRVYRSKVDVRAVAHFRELDDVRADLDAALGDGIRSLGLVAGPALSVTVARPGPSGKGA